MCVSGCRDLKPSNIFMQEDLSISIGDFGVATIMGDSRTKTRTTVGEYVFLGIIMGDACTKIRTTVGEYVGHLVSLWAIPTLKQEILWMSMRFTWCHYGRCPH